MSGLVSLKPLATAGVSAALRPEVIVRVLAINAARHILLSRIRFAYLV
jgi:hypothetical protein